MSFYEYLIESTLRKGDAVEVINKNDDRYGQTGFIYKKGTGKQKGYYTVIFADDQIISYEDSELKKVK